MKSTRRRCSERSPRTCSSAWPSRSPTATSARSRTRRSSEANGVGSLSDDLFFSFVTLTTTGYGNLVPAGNPGQSLAVFEALLGQLFLVTAVGKIVTAWRPKGWRDESTADPDPSPA